VHRTAVIASLALGLSLVGASDAAAASCGTLRDPFKGTRYSDVSVRSIRASGVSCATARTLAAKATYRGLIIGTAPSGVRRYSLDGYRVRRDTRATPERFTAKDGKRRVSWTS
jgi:hypothetical protein